MVLPEYEGKCQQVLVDMDLLRVYLVFPEPVTIKRGVVCCIPDSIPDPIIDEGIEITPLHGLNIQGRNKIRPTYQSITGGIVYRLL